MSLKDRDGDIEQKEAQIAALKESFLKAQEKYTEKAKVIIATILAKEGCYEWGETPTRLINSSISFFSLEFRVQISMY